MLENYDKEKYILFTIRKIEIFKEELQQSKPSDYAYSEKSQTKTTEQYLLPRENGIATFKDGDDYYKLNFRLWKEGELDKKEPSFVFNVMHDDIIDTHNNIINGKKSTQIFFNDFCGFIPSLLIIKAGTPNYCIEEFEYIIKYYFDKEKQVEQPCSIVNTLISKGPEWPEQEVAVFEMKIKYKDEEVDTGDLKWLERRVTLLERRVQSMCDNYANFMLTFG